MSARSPILGIGVDIVSIPRIEKLLSRFGDKLLMRILTPSERASLPAIRTAAYVAKRFAAKEAAAKALGTGIAAGVTFQDFEVTHDERGCPQLILSGQAKHIATQKGITACALSMSDEKVHVVAMVVLSN